MIQSVFSGVNYAYMELGDVDTPLFDSQISDVASLKLAKRRAERAAIYAMINECVAPGAVLTHSVYGSPAIEGVDCFSLSHSSRFAAVAWADCSEANAGVGVDVEEDSARLPRLADKYLSKDEHERLSRLSDSPYLAAWVVKEAVFKASGCPGAVLRDVTIESARLIGDGIVVCEAELRSVKSVVMACFIAPDAMIAVAKSSKISQK